jgi:hypothetical protein
MPVPDAINGTRARSASADESRQRGGEEGAALVEMAISITMFVSALIGVVYLIFGLYSYNFVADAAREASRYASTRGAQCSVNTPRLGDCGLIATRVEALVQGMQYPGLNARNLVANTQWLQANTTGPTGWTTCAGECNAPGNMVKVVVTYAYPISVPFWARTTIDVSSTSTMVISQ